MVVRGEVQFHPFGSPLRTRLTALVERRTPNGRAPPRSSKVGSRYGLQRSYVTGLLPCRHLEALPGVGARYMR